MVINPKPDEKESLSVFEFPEVVSQSSATRRFFVPGCYAFTIQPSREQPIVQQDEKNALPVSSGSVEIAKDLGVIHTKGVPRPSRDEFFSYSKIYFLLPVDSFVWEDQQYSISPPLIFKRKFNEETRLVEVLGEGVYEDLFLYGETLNDALQILREEILPDLWADYISENPPRLSERAEKMTFDLGNRVEKNAFKKKRR